MQPEFPRSFPEPEHGVHPSPNLAPCTVTQPSLLILEIKLDNKFTAHAPAFTPPRTNQGQPAPGPGRSPLQATGVNAQAQPSLAHAESEPRNGKLLPAPMRDAEAGDGSGMKRSEPEDGFKDAAQTGKRARLSEVAATAAGAAPQFICPTFRPPASNGAEDSIERAEPASVRSATASGNGQGQAGALSLAEQAARQGNVFGEDESFSEKYYLVEAFNDDDPARRAKYGGLLKAIGTDDIKSAHELLKDPEVDVNARGPAGLTVLMLALGRKAYTIVDALLRRPDLLVNDVNDPGETALAICAFKCDLEGAQRLLKVKEVDVNRCERKGDTPLIRACSNGGLQFVEVLLKARNIDVNRQNRDGRTPLIAAVIGGHCAVVSKLLQTEGIIVGHRDKQGMSALHCACGTGRADIVQLLLGANEFNVKERNAKGESPLSLAVDKMLFSDEGGHLAVVALLLTALNAEVVAEQKWTTLMTAALLQDLTRMQALLASPETEVNAKDYRGMTALMIAATYASAEPAKKLLAVAGTDINARDAMGWTALMHAARHGRLAQVRDLLAVPGIDIAVRAQPRSTWGPKEDRKRVEGAIEIIVLEDGRLQIVKPNALTLAVGQEHVDVARALLNASRNSGKKGETDIFTALYLAIEKGNLAIVQALLDAEGMDLNFDYGSIVVNGACSALECASKGKGKGAPYIVQALLNARGIDVNRRGNGRPPVLFSVAKRADKSMMELLLRAGADINVINLMMLDSREDGQVVQGVINVYNHYRAYSQDVPYLLVRNLVQPLKREFYKGIFPGAVSPFPGRKPLGLSEIYGEVISGKCGLETIRHLLMGGVSLPGRYREILADALALSCSLGFYHASPGSIFLHRIIWTALEQTGLARTYKETITQLNTLIVHINRHQADGQTLLAEAARKGDLTELGILLDLRADMRLPGRNGDTALLAAAKAEQWAACAELLSRGANANTSDRNNYSTLYYLAAAFADTETENVSALAKLIRYAIAKGWSFDQEVENHDPVTREEFPTIRLNDLLVSQPRRVVEYGRLIFGMA
jgi:ankyrin repeat protein